MKARTTSCGLANEYSESKEKGDPARDQDSVYRYRPSVGKSRR